MTPEPQLTYAALAATMELSHLRSTLRVGTALVSRFPTEDDWWELVSDPEYIESLNTLAEIINDIRSDGTVVESMTPESIADAADKHYGRALESIELIAERLGVPPDDLLNVLIST